MGLIRDRSRRTAPLKMLIFGLFLIGLQAYMAAGSGAVEFMVGFSLKKLLIQVPAGIVAVWIASKFIEFDFGTIGGIAIKIAAITVLAEGVACWIPIPFFSIIADLTVMLVGFFVLFELSKWQTYLIVLLISPCFSERIICWRIITISQVPTARGPCARSPARQTGPCFIPGIVTIPRSDDGSHSIRTARYSPKPWG